MVGRAKRTKVRRDGCKPAALAVAAFAVLGSGVFASPMAVAAEVAASASGPALGALDPKAERDFAIPAGELGAVLTQWAELSGRRLLAASQDLDGVRSDGLTGRHAPDGALDLLLAGTGLTHHYTNASTVTVIDPQYAQLRAAPPSGEITLDEVAVAGAAGGFAPGGAGGAGRERGDGPVQGYRATRSTTATRTDTPLIETPSSVSVVPRDLIEDRLSLSTADVLALVPSVTQLQSYQGYEAFTIRGLFTDTDNGVKLDSFRTRNVVRFDPGLFERVEVLKGPASLLYGTMEPGGIVNFVTPRPTALPFVNFGGSVGSYNDVRGTFDASYTLDNGVGVRLPVVARRFDTFRDFVDDNRYFGATPSITVPLGDDTVARLLVTYIDQDLADDTVLIPIFNNRPLPIPRSRFLGQPGARQKESLLQTILTVDHRFNENLLWRNAVSFLNTWADRDTVINVFGVNPDGRTIDRARVFGDEDFDSVQVRSELLAEGRLWGVDHTLLTGVDLNSYANNLLNNGGFLVPIDVLAPAYDPTFAGPPTALFDNYRFKGKTQTLGAYIQDQATLLRDLPYLHKLILVSGLRYDAYEQDLRVRGNLFGFPADTDQQAKESALSPRVGLIYMPIRNLSLYGSYAQSLVPQEISSLADNPSSPQKGELLEAGVKVDLTERFFVTTSVFDIVKTNVPRPGLLPGTTVLTGEERSRGYEVEFAGEILPGWQAFGGYTYIDAIITKGDDVTTGNRVYNAPRHRASLWSSYTVPEGPWRGFGGGAGVTFTGDRFADFENLVLLKGFATVDAALWYRPAAGTFAFLGAGRPFFQVGVKNLLDEQYFLGGNGFNSVTPSTPRTFYVSANLRF